MNLLRAFALLLLPCLVYAGGAPEGSLTIDYTASLNGNLDGCECQSNPRAGLVTRAAYQRRRSTDSSILLDAGDVLGLVPDSAMVRHLLETYAELGYDAVALGEQDLRGGGEALAASAREFPFLRADNLALRLPAGSVPLSRAPLVVTKGGVSVAVIALTDPDVLLRGGSAVSGLVSLTPLSVALEDALSRTSASMLTVVLLHGTIESARRLAELAPKLGGTVDLIVVGHEQTLLDPLRVGATLIVSPGEEGNRVCRLDLKVRDGRIKSFQYDYRRFDFAFDADDPAVRDRVNRWKEKLRL
jgi:2',3'-cyclic-nucleotide 2'-phosphodiesterase (5'-nucleotidase family)